MSTEKRECPHCHGSLKRYEDPLAVEIIDKLTANPPPAVDPSDLVAAGDALLHALRAVQARLPCGCDDYGPCKRCAAAAIEAETAAEAWKEAKKEANEI